MSDCSISRERKEPLVSSVGIDAEDLQKCIELIANVMDAPDPDCVCNLTDVYHSVKELDQRYQQLEQVALDLYNSAWCAWFLKIDCSIPNLDKELKERDADSYLQNEREQLKALGIEV